MADQGSAGGLPPMLYHYTDADGLLGIVKTRTLWATDVQFLNDGSELVYAADKISSHARDRAKELERSRPSDHWDSGRAEALYGVADGLDDHADGTAARVYVSCFCTQGDLLSQWRGYGRAGGFALGFDTADLAPVLRDRLQQVDYGDEVIAPLLDDLESVQPVGHPSVSGFYWAQVTVLPWLARVKDPAFAEEDEWRAILVSAEEIPSDLRFRTSASLGGRPIRRVRLQR